MRQVVWHRGECGRARPQREFAAKSATLAGDQWRDLHVGAAECGPCTERSLNPYKVRCQTVRQRNKWRLVHEYGFLKD